MSKVSLQSKVIGHDLTYKELIDYIIEDVGLKEVCEYVDEIYLNEEAKY